MTESHHSWSSLDSSIQLHVNSGTRSFKLRNLQDPLHPEDSHVTCQRVVNSAGENISSNILLKLLKILIFQATPGVP